MLYALRVPKGPRQTVRYDDGSGDELEVPLATTAFISGKTTFDILPTELKSVAVRAKVKYAPHTFTWMATARALPTGLGMETEGREVPLDDLPAWDESKIKTYPFVRTQSLSRDVNEADFQLTVVEEPGHTYPTLPSPRLRRNRTADRPSPVLCQSRRSAVP